MSSCIFFAQILQEMWEYNIVMDVMSTVGHLVTACVTPVWVCLLCKYILEYLGILTTPTPKACFHNSMDTSPFRHGETIEGFHRRHVLGSNPDARPCWRHSM